MTTQQINNTTLRQAENRVSLTGVLLEKEIRESKPNAAKPFKTARLTIATGDTEQHQIEMFAMKYKNDGTENGMYKGIETIENDFKSVAEVGEENADKVTTNAGRIQLNDYVGGDGQLKSFPQLSTPFINRVETSETYEPEATFSVECVVDRVVSEMDKEGNETGRVKLFTFIPLYGGQVIPFEFLVHKDGSPYVEDNYTKGDTVSVHGQIINKKLTVESEKEMGFGQPQKVIKYETTREYLVLGGTPVYEEDSTNTYNTDAIRQALTEREVYLEGLKKKKQDSVNNKPTGGFDVGSKPKAANPFGESDVGTEMELPF